MASSGSKGVDATVDSIRLTNRGSTNVTVRLMVSYFNWIWRHTRFKATVAQRAQQLTNPGLA